MRSRLTAVPPHFRAALTGAATIVAILATACSSNSDNGGGGPPARLVIAAGDGLNETVGANVGPFVIKVTDTLGTPIPNVVVNFAASTGLTLTSASATTGQDGTAFTAGTFSHVSGNRTVTATVSGIPTPAVFHVTANTDVASIFAIASGNNQTGAVGTPLGEALSVTVTDQYGNPIPNVTVAWSVIRGGTLGSAQTRTGPDGLTTTTFTFGALAGAFQVTAAATINATASTLTFTETAN